MSTQGKKLTLADIAKRAGVSRSLASLALRGEPGVQPEKRARILAIAAELDYTPDPAARNLASHATRTLGVVVSDILNPFSASLAKAVDAAARQQGLDVLLSIDGYPDSAATAAIAAMVRQRVAGLILIGTPDTVSNLEHTARQLPIVYVGRDLGLSSLCSVCNDDHLGARLLVQHLAALGHRHIVHIDGGNGAGALRRREGYCDAMRALALEPQVIAGGYTLDSGAAGAAAALLLQPRPTAIFAANDLAATGVLNHLALVQVRVPQDIAVVGYDDMPFAGSATLALTTIQQPISEMAQASVAAILRPAGKQAPAASQVSIIPTLIVRRSSAGEQAAS